MRKRLKRVLAETLSIRDCIGIYSGFDIIGDIAIVRTSPKTSMSISDVAEAIMKQHNSVKAVFAQTTEVQGDFRLRGLTHVAGEKRTRTVHRESGCSFKVDIKTCYFSPRLSGERLRIANLVKPNETIVNMFAGVGCFSIVITKHLSETKVYSVDINPEAVRFLTENIRINRVYGRVLPILGDAKLIIEDRLQGCADRVLMPLPEKAFDYLSTAVSALKPEGGWIHVHVFEHATKTESPSMKVIHKVSSSLDALHTKFEITNVRVVRSTGPNWWQLVADIHVCQK